MRMKVIAFVFLCVLLTACAAHSDSAVEDSPTWQEQYDLGLRYLEEGNYEEAILAFTAAIEIAPKQAEAYIKTAEAYVALEDYNNAWDILEKGYIATGDISLLLVDWLQYKEPQEGALWVLTYWAAYRTDMTVAEYNQYEYDEYGYMIKRVIQAPKYTYDTGNSTYKDYLVTYSYTDDHLVEQNGLLMRRAMYTFCSAYNGTLDAVYEEPREFMMLIGTPINDSNGWIDNNEGGAICCDALLIPEHRQEVEETGRLTLYSFIEDDPLKGSYAEFEFDSYGNPVTIVSYGPDGTQMGTAILRWESIMPQPMRLD